MSEHLNPTDVRILRHLLEVGPDSPSGIAEVLESHPKNVGNRFTRFMNKLEEPPVDRRSSGVYVINDEGRRRLEEHLRDGETILELELRRERLVENGELTERGREWLHALEARE